MNDYDPFAGATDGPTPEDFVTTMRVGSGQDAPTVTVRAKTGVEFADKIGSLTGLDIGAIVGATHTALKATYAAAAGLDATPTQSAAYSASQAPQNGAQGQQQGWGQQQQQQPQGGYQQPPQQNGPPAGPIPQCPHGQKNWVGPGISKKTNKPYSGFWGCPAAQSAPDKCRPEWPKG